VQQASARQDACHAPRFVSVRGALKAESHWHESPSALVHVCSCQAVAYPGVVSLRGNAVPERAIAKQPRMCTSAEGLAQVHTHQVHKHEVRGRRARTACPAAKRTLQLARALLCLDVQVLALVVLARLPGACACSVPSLVRGGVCMCMLGRAGMAAG